MQNPVSLNGRATFRLRKGSSLAWKLVDLDHDSPEAGLIRVAFDSFDEALMTTVLLAGIGVTCPEPT